MFVHIIFRKKFYHELKLVNPPKTQIESSRATTGNSNFCYFRTNRIQGSTGVKDFDKWELTILIADNDQRSASGR